MLRAALLLPGLAIAIASSAQYTPPDPSGFQGLILERYYVADANDAADTDGGPGLIAGATTYRVFVDLKPGYKLLTVGGFQNHPISMGTSTTFFNNEDRGETWGYSINDIHLDVNTVAIDSWLTIGGASDVHWGVPKTADTDGSIVGGANNDGGSNGVPEGLLTNDDVTAGIPLTTQDGLWNAGVAPPGVNALGTAPDLFDPAGGSTYTNDNYAWAVLGGATAPDTANRILIGQFTTNGDLSMCLNLFVKLPDDVVCNDPDCHDFMIFYADLLPTDTSSTTILDDNIFTHPTLCLNSTSAQVDCEGTLGGTALPGTACDDGDPDTEDDEWDVNCVCAGIETAITEHAALALNVAPNPVRDLLRVRIDGTGSEPVSYELIDVLGQRAAAQDLGVRTNGWSGAIDMGAMPQGLYFLHLRVGDQRHVERIVKL